MAAEGIFALSVLVILVGFNGAGKTTLAKKLETDLGFNVVSGDPLRLLIKKEIRYFNDFDISIPTEKGLPTRTVIDQYRKGMSKILLEVEQNVIYDSNALKKSDRKSIFEAATQGTNGVTKIILYVDISEQELMDRIRNRPEKNWVEHYEVHKKPVFEMPENDECDKLLVYNQHNYDDVKTELQKLIN